MGVKFSDKEDHAYMLELDDSEAVIFSAAFQEDKDYRERTGQHPHEFGESMQNLRPDHHRVFHGSLEHIESSATLLRDFNRRTGLILDELHFRTPPFLRVEDVRQMRVNLGSTALLLADSIGKDLSELIVVDESAIPDTPHILLQARA